MAPKNPYVHRHFIAFELRRIVPARLVRFLRRVLQLAFDHAGDIDQVDVLMSRRDRFLQDTQGLREPPHGP